MMVEEIERPEQCIMCHKPRLPQTPAGMQKLKPDNKLAQDSPFCSTCFTTTAPYYREHLMWTRRNALALESLSDLIGLGLVELSAVAELVRKFSPVLINVEPPAPLQIIDRSGEAFQGT